VIAESFGRAAASPDILAQSDWLDFDVSTAATGERERWLTSLLAAPPADPGLYVGDFLPSLLASAEDSRVLAAVIDGTYREESPIASCARTALSLWPAELAVPLVMGRLQRPGPNERLAYFISWHAPWFQDRREDLIRSATDALQSRDDVIVQGGLFILYFAEHFDWPANAAALDDASRALIAAAPSILARNERVVHTLALALGTTRNASAAAPLLQQIVDRRNSASEQASIALRWLSQRGQPRPLGSTVGPAILKLQSKDAADRKAAAQTLIELGSSQAQPAVAQSVGANLLDEIIRRHRFVDNEDAWRDAVLILGRLRAAVYAGSLTLYLIHDGVTDALIEMGEPAVPAVTDILKVGGPQRRRLAAGVLGAVGGSAASVALTAARATETDAQVRNAIEYALAHLGERPPRAEIR
jgi:hypothetical protein